MLKTFAKLLAAFGTGGLSLLGSVLPGLATSIGDIFVKYKQTAAAREGKQDEQGTVLAGSYLSAVTEANRTRAAVRKAEGTWGPLGITTMGIGGFIVLHFGAVVLDSMPLLPGIGWAWYFPYPTLVPHTPCLCVAALPKSFQEAEIAAIQALFYTAPPAAAAVAVAKIFRR